MDVKFFVIFFTFVIFGAIFNAYKCNNKVEENINEKVEQTSNDEIIKFLKK